MIDIIQFYIDKFVDYFENMSRVFNTIVNFIILITDFAINTFTDLIGMLDMLIRSGDIVARILPGIIPLGWIIPLTLIVAVAILYKILGRDG